MAVHILNLPNKKQQRNTTVNVNTGSVITSREEPIAKNKFEAALIGQRYNTTLSYKLSAVYAAMSLISNSIALLPINVKQRADNKSTIIENHPICKLFYEMLQSKHTVIKKIIWDLLLTGNAYVYIKRTNGIPTKLVYLEHQDVNVFYDKLNDEVKYTISNHKKIPTDCPINNILHFAKDTKDGIIGRGFAYFAADVLELAGFTQQAAIDFFGSGCMLFGWLKFKGRVNDVQKEKIRSQWTQTHGASNGAGAKLGILEGDGEFIPQQQDANNSQMLETREFNITEIARFFNISPILLGDLSHNSYSSIEDASIEFVTHTLLPIINLLEEEMNRKLIYKDKEYIDLDENVLMKGNKATMANYYGTLFSKGLMTANECRQQLGLNRIDTEEADSLNKADSLIIPFTDISQNTLGGVDTGNK